MPTTHTNRPLKRIFCVWLEQEDVNENWDYHLKARRADVIYLPGRVKFLPWKNTSLTVICNRSFVDDEKSFPLVEETYEPEPQEIEPVKEEKKGFFDWLFDLFN